MSGVIEKTFGGLVNSIFGSSQSTSKDNQTPPLSGLKNVSLGLINFVEKLSTSRQISRQEEEWFVKKELKDWQEQLSSRNVNGSIVADLLCRALIAAGRGHDMSNLNIHAIKLCQSSIIFQKKIGYLFVSQCMGPKCELGVLLVNTILKDLSSPNVLEVAAGHSIIPALAQKSLVPSILTALSRCLAHHQPYIRKKSAIIIGTLATSESASDVQDNINEVIPHLRHLMADTNPGVAVTSTYSLSLIYKHLSSCPYLQDQIALSAAHIITESLRGGLPKDYNSCVVTAPFVLVEMLKAIQAVSDDDWKVPDEVISAITDVLNQPWGGREMSLYMVLVESVETVAILPRNLDTITLALQIVLGLAKSTNIDFKYLGIKGLSSLLRHLEDLVTSEQLEVVLDCLYYSDAVLRAKTLNLICNMANAQNYRIVCSTLLEFGSLPENIRFKEKVKSQLSKILETHCEDITWCTSCMLVTIFEENYSLNFHETIIKIATISLTKSDDKNSAQLSCKDLVTKIFENYNDSFIYLLTNLIKLMILEYPDDDYAQNISIFIEKLHKIEDYDKLDLSVFECLKIICVNYTSERDKIMKLLKLLRISLNIDIQYKTHELMMWLENIEMSNEVLDMQADILGGSQVPDFSLSFLDEYVVESLSKGADLYKPFNEVIQEVPSFEDKIDVTESSCLSLLSIPSEDTRSMSSFETQVTRSLSPRQNVWSVHGRTKLDECESPNKESELLLSFHESKVMDNASSVEVADEAEEIDNSVSSLTVINNKTSQLAQSLLIGFGLSKEKVDA